MCFRRLRGCGRLFGAESAAIITILCLVTFFAGAAWAEGEPLQQGDPPILRLSSDTAEAVGASAETKKPSAVPDTLGTTSEAAAVHEIETHGVTSEATSDRGIETRDDAFPTMPRNGRPISQNDLDTVLMIMAEITTEQVTYSGDELLGAIETKAAANGLGLNEFLTTKDKLDALIYSYLDRILIKENRESLPMLRSTLEGMKEEYEKLSALIGRTEALIEEAISGTETSKRFEATRKELEFVERKLEKLKFRLSEVEGSQRFIYIEEITHFERIRDEYSRAMVKLAAERRAVLDSVSENDRRNLQADAARKLESLKTDISEIERLIGEAEAVGDWRNLADRFKARPGSEEEFRLVEANLDRLLKYVTKDLGLPRHSESN